jgi:formylglycine-generating enzyme required for sulfatase activity
LQDSSPDATDAADAAPPSILSCATSGDGRTNCGSGSESCCTSLAVSGGTYNRTYTNTGDAATGEADPATVSDFRLDKYEVTVGRFRQFVAAWNGGAGWTPPEASGKHTHLNGGSGLAATGGGYEPGWLTSDNGSIAPTNVNLACDAGFATWTPAAGANEKRPITCVNWWEAVAFCIWDGGFLPSEAEWEYAAAGGALEREYPWGSTAPGTNNVYAIYGCDYPSSSGSCTNVANIAPAGTPTAGAGKYGQLDLAGNAWEWNLDYWHVTYYACTDCTNATSASTRVVRGGGFNFSASSLLPPFREYYAPTTRYSGLGFRCARTP